MDQSTTTTNSRFTITSVELGYESLAWMVVSGLAALVLVGYLVLADKRRKKRDAERRARKI